MTDAFWVVLFAVPMSFFIGIFFRLGWDFAGTHIIEDKGR